MGNPAAAWPPELALRTSIRLGRVFSRLRVTSFMIVFALASLPRVSIVHAGEDIAKDASPPPKRPLTELSLDELLEVKVTSVAKKPQKASQSAAAIYVITNDDIRHTGVRSIPEALRLAPGMQVGKLNSHTWAITSRGFDDVFANKLLVLIDGRSVYTPLFSGVFWDVQNVMLEDVERIEVIRGPGATLWGANAVNGVINVITKSAKETQGGLLVAGGGTEERGFASLRYGGKLGKNVYIRGYGSFFAQDEQVLSNGNDGRDRWNQGRGGFRLDWDLSSTELLTVQGDAYVGDENELNVTPLPATPFSRIGSNDSQVNGGNLLARWSHQLSANSDLKLQFYYDRTHRFSQVLEEDRDTFDLDFQHGFLWGRSHHIIWGAGYRLTHDQTNGSFSAQFRDETRSVSLASAFIQDEISILDKVLSLTLGSKFEFNDFTGFEYQPTGRVVWTPHSRHTIWSAVSRAVRTPSRADDNVRLNTAVFPPGTLGPGTPPATVSLFGDKDFKSEELIAFELGYRVQPHARVSLDLAAFYNLYDGLRTIEPRTSFLEATPPPAHLVVPFRAGNKMRGETYGAELTASWQALDWWRFHGSYSHIQVRLHPSRSSKDATAEGPERDSPQNQFVLRSSMNLPKKVELDVILRYVDTLPNRNIQSYVTSDVRVGWRPTDRLELSVTGQNLFDDKQPEFAPSFISTVPTEVQRGFYAKLTWKF